MHARINQRLGASHIMRRRMVSKAGIMSTLLYKVTPDYIYVLTWRVGGLHGVHHAKPRALRLTTGKSTSSVKLYTCSSAGGTWHTTALAMSPLKASASACCDCIVLTCAALYIWPPNVCWAGCCYCTDKVAGAAAPHRCCSCRSPQGPTARSQVQQAVWMALTWTHLHHQYHPHGELLPVIHPPHPDP